MTGPGQARKRGRTPESHPTSGAPAPDLELDRIYHMDCLKGMLLLPNSSIDLVVTDPPFAIEFRAQRSNYNRTQSRVLEGYNEIPRGRYYDFCIAWMREVYRLLKESGSMYVFSGWNNLKDMLVALDEVGFVTVNHIIWKYQFGVVTRRKYVTSHYHCLYVCKNDAKRKFYPFARFGKEFGNGRGGSLHYEDKEDVWVIKREYWHGDQKTPTKLPADLVKKILQYSSQEGDLVLDPFLGSGQVAVVAKALNRRFIGFEIVDEYFRFAQERLATGQYRLRDTERVSATGQIIPLDLGAESIGRKPRRTG